jgi:7-carboxy-7-deazaguanine synthase
MSELKLPICDLFVSIQGEGLRTGRPSIFIRVSGCNLRCVFKGSICDTPYSSFNPEKSSYTIEDVKRIIADNPQVNDIVITGGEPLMYKNQMEAMLEEIYEDRFYITIETNGSLPMLNPLNPKFKISLYSVSPKLHTSIAQPGQVVDTPSGKKIFGTEEVENLNKKRINIKTLSDIVLYAKDYQFKFVYSGQECISEIEDIYDKMEKFAEEQGPYQHSYFKKNHPKKNTMLMPEGITEEQLKAKRIEMANECIKKGWTYTDRIHILIWGDKRGV